MTMQSAQEYAREVRSSRIVGVTTKVGGMQSWPVPEHSAFDSLTGTPVPLNLYDSADDRIKPVKAGKVATMYVCGITPYDATHLGHAATYLAFDLIYRQLKANGHDVHYVQNVTDVDDPLFERAERDNVDWRELGTSQIDLFRSDMEKLSVFPPQDFVGVQEAVDEVIDMVQELIDKGVVYAIDDPEYPDLYVRVNATEQFGYESRFSREEMLDVFAERGGDPERPGKKDPLDALVWKMARPGEPSWDAPFGAGRPGWHIECSAIARNRLSVPFDIQGGGRDLVFPHHEFSAAHAEAATGEPRMAGHYVHGGMIALDGVKMSKSLGNLVFVSKLLEEGHTPAAIRLSVFSGHYRADRDFSGAILKQCESLVERLRASVDKPSTRAETEALVTEIREALADDLDTPRAIAAIEAWANREWTGDSDPEAGRIVASALDALLGIKL